MKPGDRVRRGVSCEFLANSAKLSTEALSATRLKMQKARHQALIAYLPNFIHE
jgi:hypothetical protein